MSDDVWTFRGRMPTHISTLNFSGYEVVGRDGSIGTVDSASVEVSASYLIVKTGEWMPGHTVMLPAGTVEKVDSIKRVITIDRTREEVRNAPEYDRRHPGNARFQDRLTGYYHGLYDTGL
jgi:hypothetical protein